MKRMLALFLTLLFCTSAIAQAQKNVAVLEIERRGAALNEISREEAMEITGVIRSAAVNILPRGQFSVMTSETVQAMGGAVLAECFDETCVIALGRTIDAEYVVRGVLSKFQTVFTLNIEMFETEYGNLVATSAAVRSESLMELLSASETVSENMFRNFLRSSVTESAQPTQPTQPAQLAQLAQPAAPVVTPRPEPIPRAPREKAEGNFVSRNRLTLQISTGALAGIGIIGGIIYNGMANDEHDKYRAADNTRDADARRNDRDSLTSTRDLLYILGGVGLACFAITFVF